MVIASAVYFTVKDLIPSEALRNTGKQAAIHMNKNRIKISISHQLIMK